MSHRAAVLEFFGDDMPAVVRPIFDDKHSFENVDELARFNNMVRSTLLERCRDTGMPAPSEWLRLERVLHAQRLLTDPNVPIEAVARRAGFSDSNALYLNCRRLLGLRPGDLRRVDATHVLTIWASRYRKELIGAKR